ncbi:hypothetical protein Tco_0938828 [Tanacetum coccineum]|uniref:Reverse transcriptase domain-containing protein n=1 Tax=Tanacetum coccineum TaxID=301880 RepID=A0ABQ5DJ85_9ASTR
MENKNTRNQLFTVIKSNVSRMNTTSRESVSKTDERIDKLADQLSTLVEIVSKKVVTPAPVKAVEEICVTCSGPHAWYNCPNTDNNQSSVCAATGTYKQVNPPNRLVTLMAPPSFCSGDQTMDKIASLRGTLSSNTIPNPKGEMKAITTQSGSIPTNPSPKKVVERETEEKMDKEQNNFQGSTAHIPPLVNPIPSPGTLVPPKDFTLSLKIPNPRDYALELLGFSNKSSGGNPTPTSEPLTSEFILEEIEAYLKDDSISLEIDHADCDLEGDICLI